MELLWARMEATVIIHSPVNHMVRSRVRPMCSAFRLGCRLPYDSAASADLVEKFSLRKLGLDLSGFDDSNFSWFHFFGKFNFLFT